MAVDDKRTSSVTVKEDDDHQMSSLGGVKVPKSSYLGKLFPQKILEANAKVSPILPDILLRNLIFACRNDSRRR